MTSSESLESKKLSKEKQDWGDNKNKTEMQQESQCLNIHSINQSNL